MQHLNDATTCIQLGAIPTVGFSDPILSYLSAVQFSFDGDRMLRDGYQRVIFFFHVPLPRVKPVTVLPLDETRAFQNSHLSEMDGAGYRN
jgi:hypothetical protein